MPTRVLLPQWGMGMNDGTIVKWLKQEGDTVEVGDLYARFLKQMIEWASN